MTKTKGRAQPMDKHAGARVRARRLEVGMSQSALAKAIGVTFQQVQKYEKGVNRMGAGRLQQIATALQVTPSYFFEGGAGRPKGSAEDLTMKLLSTKNGVELAKRFVAIKSAVVQRRVVQMVGDLAR